MSASATPALLSASKAMPADMAPSPMMATTLRASPLLLGGQRHAERGGDRGRRMADAEGVVRALAALGKAGDAAVHAQAAHAFAAAGEHLVRVALVADVPDQPVLRRVEDVVQRDGQFDGAEVGRQVAAGLRHRFDQEVAQLAGQLRQLLALEAAQVGRDCRWFRATNAWKLGSFQNCRSQMKSASSDQARRRARRRRPGAACASARSSPA